MQQLDHIKNTGPYTNPYIPILAGFQSSFRETINRSTPEQTAWRCRAGAASRQRSSAAAGQSITEVDGGRSKPTMRPGHACVRYVHVFWPTEVRVRPYMRPMHPCGPEKKKRGEKKNYHTNLQVFCPMPCGTQIRFREKHITVFAGSA